MWDFYFRILTFICVLPNLACMVLHSSQFVCTNFSSWCWWTDQRSDPFPALITSCYKNQGPALWPQSSSTTGFLGGPVDPLRFSGGSHFPSPDFPNKHGAQRKPFLQNFTCSQQLSCIEANSFLEVSPCRCTQTHLKPALTKLCSGGSIILACSPD